MTESGPLWKQVSFRPGQCARWRLGALDLWVHRAEHEWRITHAVANREEDAESFDPNAEAPAGAPWKRWAANPDDTELRVSPTTPDRSLIMRPETVFTVLPDYEARFFVSIPLCLRVTVGTDRTFLSEHPSVRLSNSWFGPTTEGELCYALKTTAKRDPSEARRRASRALCPVLVQNNSDTPLVFERLRVMVRYLSIYRGEQQYWTNECRVTYRGESESGRLVYDREPPPFDAASERVGPPREPLPAKGFLFNSVDNLRSLASELMGR